MGQNSDLRYQRRVRDPRRRSINQCADDRYKQEPGRSQGGQDAGPRFQFGLPHRYTHDAARLTGGIYYVFVNLSPYPVSVGLCQSDLPLCVGPQNLHANPMEQIEFNRDQNKRYSVISSTAGVSVMDPAEIRPGTQHTFTTESAIQFDPVK